MFRGDFKGLVEKLDYIKALGLSAVWITPVVLNRSPWRHRARATSGCTC
jgi:glycosidase